MPETPKIGFVVSGFILIWQNVNVFIQKHYFKVVIVLYDVKNLTFGPDKHKNWV